MLLILAVPKVLPSDFHKVFPSEKNNALLPHAKANEGQALEFCDQFTSNTGDFAPRVNAQSSNL